MILTVSILLLFSCGNNPRKAIQGKIYIKLIDVQNFSGFSSKEINWLEDFAYNKDQKEYSSSEKKLVGYYKFLKEQNLVGKPFFKLETDSGEIINVFTNRAEYNKIENELKGLNRDQEEIIVLFRGEKISKGFFNEGLYFAKKIISVEKKKGITHWRK
ncbi:hypothetical protein [Sinomicrobium soli]|uniref:hypothetical protein n=1 Tax=Sinomicrobium sp. N-1-3-6 TaxID=2219864 RepID=UPI0011BF04CD|nr:hypothetical protein [Sinomicrobium sp. N-1-3-6]